jgi:long-subunit acyl-CoA synthetase (AMP-forming)
MWRDSSSPFAMGRQIVGRRPSSDDDDTGFSHTCGPVFPNAEVVLVDTEQLTSIAPGQRLGEIWVRASNVTMGYIDNPKETNDMINISGQGWMM